MNFVSSVNLCYMFNIRPKTLKLAKDDLISPKLIQFPFYLSKHCEGFLELDNRDRNARSFNSKRNLSFSLVSLSNSWMPMRIKGIQKRKQENIKKDEIMV